MQARRLAEALDPWLGVPPAYAAVASGMRSLALDGRLPAGVRVPSERELALALSLSRTTVSAAYDVLREEGYLRSERGAGSRIALPADVPVRPDAAAGGRDVVLDLSVAALPAPPQLLDAVSEAALALRPLLSGHGLHPLGVPALRAGVAAHLSARGLPTRAEQVLITSGALAGWDLLLRALTRPGSRVLVEQPTYPAVLDAVKAHGLRAFAMPVTASGWEAPSAPAQLAHVTPDAQNPTGLLASGVQRRSLLHSLHGPNGVHSLHRPHGAHDPRRGHATTVVADETFADLVLDGPAPVPLAALDRRVITLGSMSKSFWAGLRIGWVRAEPELLGRLAQARGASDLASPVLEQLVAAALLQRAEVILPARCAGLRRTRDALAAALRRELPEWRFCVPPAGMCLWVEPRMSTTRLTAHALDLGLRLIPGPRFTLDGTADGWLRLPFSLPVDSVEPAVAMLGEAARRTLAGHQAVSGSSHWTV